MSNIHFYKGWPVTGVYKVCLCFIVLYGIVFEPEREVELEMSISGKAKEILENERRIGEEHLGNIIWYINISVVTKLFCMSETSLYRSGASVGSIMK